MLRLAARLGRLARRSSSEPWVRWELLPADARPPRALPASPLDPDCYGNLDGSVFWEWGGPRPLISPATYVARGGRVIGNVSLDLHSSVWPEALIDGAHNQVTVGHHTSILDGVEVRALASPPGKELEDGTVVTTVPRGHNDVVIGCRVVIGAGSRVTSAHIGHEVVLETGVVVEPHARIEQGSVLLSGTRVPAGAVIPAYQVWAGSPARYIRHLSHHEAEELHDMVDRMASRAKDARYALGASGVDAYIDGRFAEAEQTRADEEWQYAVRWSSIDPETLEPRAQVPATHGSPYRPVGA